MDELINLVILLIVAAVWVGKAVIKKAREQQQEAAPSQKPGKKSAYAAGEDDVKAFLQQMGGMAKPKPSPPPPPVPAEAKPAQTAGSAAPAKTSAADALRAAASRRISRRKAAPSPFELRKEPRPTTAVESLETGLSRNPLDEASDLSFMQRAVLLREILGPAPGLSADPYHKET